jgi:hypothetical protein
MRRCLEHVLVIVTVRERHREGLLCELVYEDSMTRLPCWFIREMRRIDNVLPKPRYSEQVTYLVVK